MIATILMFLGEAWRWTWRTLQQSAIARYVAIILLAVLLTLIVVWARSCRDRPDPLDPVVIETGQNANHAIDKLQNANSNVTGAETNTNKARENLNRIKPEVNVSIEEAKRNLCKAYPDDPQCKGL